MTLLTAFGAYEIHEDRKLVPPKGLTLDTFFDWLPATDSALVHESEGAEYLILIGPRGRTLASGPSTYVFDKSGTLVDWSTDSGDDGQFQEQWHPWGQWIEVDRKVAAEWRAKP